MSYEIQYTPEDNKRYPLGKHRQHGSVGKMVVILGVVLSGIALRLYGFPDFLIPGDPQVTKAAAANFMESMRRGEGIESSITVFCKEVLEGA